MITYQITVRGLVDVDELNLASPHHMTLVQAQPGVTQFSICTDQSGLIGLLRHLHNLGFDFQSITCAMETILSSTERKE